MYGIFIGLSFLQQFRPYLRKYISNILDKHEYFFLNTIMILFIISLYIVYLLTTKKTTFHKIKTNIQSLSCKEFGCIFLMACLTVISGLFIFELDKNYNTPLMNSIFLKSLSTIALIFVGIFIFQEFYHIHQLFGIGLIILGIYLTSQKTL
jgi:drug/metabolite transporter (DMT)-like permease